MILDVFDLGFKGRIFRFFLSIEALRFVCHDSNPWVARVRKKVAIKVSRLGGSMPGF